jgi:hypothetical protein
MFFGVFFFECRELLDASLWSRLSKDTRFQYTNLQGDLEIIAKLDNFPLNFDVQLSATSKLGTGDVDATTLDNASKDIVIDLNQPMPLPAATYNTALFSYQWNVNGASPMPSTLAPNGWFLCSGIRQNSRIQ